MTSPVWRFDWQEGKAHPRPQHLHGDRRSSRPRPLSARLRLGQAVGRAEPKQTWDGGFTALPCNSLILYGTKLPVSGWKDVLVRVRRRVVDDNLTIIVAGVAFYALSATFAGLLALSGIYEIPIGPSESGARMLALKNQLMSELGESAV